MIDQITTLADRFESAAVTAGVDANPASKGGKVGVYSTSDQWSRIVGATSNLKGLDTWVPGARTLRGASASAPFTAGGKVTAGLVRCK